MPTPKAFPLSFTQNDIDLYASQHPRPRRAARVVEGFAKWLSKTRPVDILDMDGENILDIPTQYQKPSAQIVGQIEPARKRKGM